MTGRKCPRPSDDFRARLLFLLCSNAGMSDRPASWRLPSAKQMEKPLFEAVGSIPLARAFGPSDDLPTEYWDAVLRDAYADAGPGGQSLVRTLRLSEISQHVLRVSCTRCGRIVDIHKTDALRLYGPWPIWKDAAQKLLDNTCSARTGRYEEDGCWPSFG